MDSRFRFSKLKNLMRDLRFLHGGDSGGHAPPYTPRWVVGKVVGKFTVAVVDGSGGAYAPCTGHDSHPRAPTRRPWKLGLGPGRVRSGLWVAKLDPS
ncbi:hypothetical protein EV1_035057 [Malus domestica]